MGLGVEPDEFIPDELVRPDPFRGAHAHEPCASVGRLYFGEVATVRPHPAG
jgi:hypothetical protein